MSSDKVSEGERLRAQGAQVTCTGEASSTEPGQTIWKDNPLAPEKARLLRCRANARESAEVRGVALERAETEIARLRQVIRNARDRLLDNWKRNAWGVTFDLDNALPKAQEEVSDGAA